MKRILTTILWGLVLIVLVLSVALIIIDYNTFCHFFISIIGITHREKELREVYLTANRFIWIKYSTFTFLLLFVFLLFYTIKNVAILDNKLKFIYISTKDHILEWWNDYLVMSVVEKIVLSSIVTIGFLSSMFYTIVSPISIDESMTYLYCTRFSFLVSISYYALPNNHIFYSVLTNITSVFPFTPLINLRFPNLIIAVLTNYIFFRYASLFFTRGVAFICLSFFAFTFMNFLYSFQARGYEIILLTSLITIYCITKILESKQASSKHLFLYSLASVIGFYTVPSYLYLFVSVTLFGYFTLVFNKRFNDVKKLAKHNALIVCTVILLYSPIFLTSGLKAIISNPYTKPVSRQVVLNNMIPHFEEVASWIYGIQNSKIAFVLLIITMVLLIFVAFKSQDSTKSKLLVFILFSAPIIVMLHSVIGFARTWIFLTIPAFITIGMIIQYISPKFNKPKVYIPIVLFTITILLVSFNQLHQKIFSFDYCIDKFSSQIDVTDVNSIGYDDINGADILKFKVLSNLNFNKNIKLIKIDTLNSFNADLVIITKGSSIPQFLNS